LYLSITIDFLERSIFTSPLFSPYVVTLINFGQTSSVKSQTLGRIQFLVELN